MTRCRWSRSWVRGGITVIDCLTCGFRHQHPIPSTTDVEAFYVGHYYQSVKPDYADGVARDRAHIEMWAGEKRSVAEASIIAALGALPATPAVLDIGSSFGQFLSSFAEHGWRCVGVEPATSPANQTKSVPGLTIHNDMLENLSTAALVPPFHLVHMREVINHLRDPADTLTRIASELLAPGGVLIVETSNDFNDLQAAIVELYDDEPWWIVPDHIAYFDMDSLTALLTRTGLAVAHREATFPMELFPLMGENYRTDPQVGKACHARRVTFELNMARIGRRQVMSRLYAALADAGFGRSLLVYAQKPATA